MMMMMMMMMMMQVKEVFPSALSRVTFHLLHRLWEEVRSRAPRHRHVPKSNSLVLSRRAAYYSLLDI
jgi:hypothetical protein